MSDAHCTNDNVAICNYNISGKLLNLVSSHKDFGVLVDSMLQFQDLIRSSGFGS